MRIALIIDWFLYYTIGLANALVEDHEVLLITRDHNYEISSPDHPVLLDAFLDECLDKRIAREKVHFKRRDLRNIAEIARVYKKIQQFSPDVLHIQETTDWRIFMLAQLFGFEKTVLTVHDVFRHPGDKRGMQGILTRKFREKTKAIIVHGEFLKDQFALSYPLHWSKVHSIPHGILDIYKNWDDPETPEEPNTILFFGRITPYKGLDVLIRAIPSVARQIPDIRLIIAGKGLDFSTYEKLIDDRAHFEIYNRFISHHEVSKFFRRASLVVLPYTEGSQSGVVAAAYAFGKPVVVTSVGSIPEVVDNGKTGFVVSPNDPRALAEAITKILRNPAMKSYMQENVRKKAEDMLSWSTIARKSLAAYVTAGQP